MDNFNLNKYFKNQYLAEGDITPSDISPYKLEKHPDIKIFADALSKALGFDVEQSLGSGSYNGRGGYYIKMPRREIRYWGDDSIKAVESAFNEANKLSKEYDFEYQGVTDYEEDPGERSWPASKGLFIKEKENIESVLKEYTDNTFKGSELIDDANERGPDMFGKQIFADLLPQGVASENDAIEALKAHDKSPIKNRMGRYAPMFVHVQYHNLEHEGEKYQMHQTQYYNGNFKDQDPNFNPRVTKITLLKDDKPLGTILVKTDEYVQDLNNLPGLGKRNMEEGSINEIHSKSKELANDYSMGELKDRLSQLYRDMEQEAEPEGGPISDQYADEITFYEDAIRLKKGPRKKDMPYDVAIGKMTQDEYDTIVSKDDFNKSSQFDRMNEGEWTYEFGELDESASTEEKRIALRAIKSIAKYRGVSEDEAKRDLIRAAKELGGLKEAINDVKETIKLGKTLNEELCAKGKAYRKKRMAAGEKSSAYLSGRAVRVCKGDIKG